MAVKIIKSKSNNLFALKMRNEGLQKSTPAMNIVVNAREKMKEMVRHEFIIHFLSEER